MHPNAAVKNRLSRMTGSAVQISADGINPFVACGAIAAGSCAGGMVQLIDGRLTGSFMTGSAVVDRFCGTAVAGRTIVEIVVCAVMVHRHTAVARFALVTGGTVQCAPGDACVAGGAIVSCGKPCFMMHGDAAVARLVGMTGDAVKL